MFSLPQIASKVLARSRSAAEGLHASGNFRFGTVTLFEAEEEEEEGDGRELKVEEEEEEEEEEELEDPMG